MEKNREHRRSIATRRALNPMLTFSVRDYGARGDGVADDTAALAYLIALVAIAFTALSYGNMVKTLKR